MSKIILKIILVFAAFALIFGSGCGKTSIKISTVVAPNNSALTTTSGSILNNTYYVAKNGSDFNQGTKAQPWLTLQKAASTLSEGDTVYVESGTYNEQVIPVHSGSTGNWITYKAYPGDTVIIDGTGINVYLGIFKIDNKSYIEIDGFEIQNSTDMGISISGECHYISLYDLIVHDTQRSGLLAMYDWNPILGKCSNIFIKDCETFRTNSNGGQEAITLVGVNNFVIASCKVHDTLGQDSSVGVQKEGITAKVGCYNGSIHDNEVYNTKLGIYAGANNNDLGFKIYNNKVHDNEIGISPSSETSIELIKNVRIYNNLIYNNYRGISFLNYPYYIINCSIINNTLFNNKVGEISIFPDVQYVYNLMIKNNILMGTQHTDNLLIYDAYPTGVIVDHNLFYNTENDYESVVFGTNYIKQDPKFVNAPNDFSLQNFSPAIDAGVSTDAPLYDFAGTPRPQGSGIDIGAFEYPNVSE